MSGRELFDTLNNAGTLISDGLGPILDPYGYLGAFAKLRRATNSFVMSVCPSS